MTGDEQAAAMIPVAADLACMVRDEDVAGIAAQLGKLDCQQFYALAVVMAAMIPDDQPVGDLLAWFEAGTPQREAMLRKAHVRAAKRQVRGLPLWGPLGVLEAEYQAGVAARRRAAEASEATEAA